MSTVRPYIRITSPAGSWVAAACGTSPQRSFRRRPGDEHLVDKTCTMFVMAPYGVLPRVTISHRTTPKDQTSEAACLLLLSGHGGGVRNNNIKHINQLLLKCESRSQEKSPSAKFSGLIHLQGQIATRDPSAPDGQGCGALHAVVLALVDVARQAKVTDLDFIVLFCERMALETPGTSATRQFRVARSL
jgi:hypothetical protein